MNRWGPLAAVVLAGVLGCDDSGRPRSSGPGSSGRAGGDARIDPGTDGGTTAPTDGGGAPRTDGGSTTGTDTGGSQSNCSTVCFEWSDRTPPPPQMGPPMHYTFTECNYAGAQPGRCPTGFTCGRNFSFVNVTFPLCEPSGAAPYRLDLDIPEPQPIDGVQVVLRFTMNGGSWPAVGAAAAGTLVITPAGTGTRLNRDMPISADGRVVLSLDPGEYFVGINMTGADVDRRRFPSVYLPAELEVRAAGEDTANLETATVDVSLHVDGSAMGPLPTRRSATLTFVGPLNQSAYVTFSEGETPQTRLVFEPGTYETTVTMSGSADATLPSGSAKTSVAVSAGTRSAVVDLQTVEVFGQVTVNRSPLPDGRSQGRMLFVPTEHTSTVRFDVGDDGAGAYRGRLFRGAYNVFYDSRSARLTGIPEMMGLVRANAQVGGRLDAAMQTVPVSGQVTSRGRALPEVGGARGEVEFEPAEKGGQRGRIPLNPTGNATYSGLLYAGAYAVSVSGNGDALSKARRTVHERWQATSTPLVMEVPTHRVLYSVLLDGRTPPDRTGGSYRAVLSLREQRTDDLPVASTAVLIPAEGPAEGSLLLPAGRWAATLSQTSSDYTGMPQGGVAVDPFDLTGDRRLDLALRAIRVSGRLTRNGRPLRDAAAGKVRGHLSFSAFSANSRTIDLGASGDAQFTFDTYPGVFQIGVLCTGEDCDRSVIGTNYVSVLYGVELR